MLPYFEQPSWHIGPLPIHAFGVMVAIALWVGMTMGAARFRREQLDVATGEKLGSWMLIGGALGAHLFATLFYSPGEIRHNPWVLLRIWEPISSFGGMLGGTLGAALFFRRRLRDLEWTQRLAYLDVAAFVFPTSLTIGRVGCALAHDHPGLVTSFPLAISLESEVARAEIARVYGTADLSFPSNAASMGFHDLGLYECLFLALVVLPVFAYWNRSRRPAGFYLTAFALLYLPVRFSLDILRIADARYLGLTPAQWVAAAILAALPLVLWRRRAMRFPVAGAVILAAAACARESSPAASAALPPAALVVEAPGAPPPNMAWIPGGRFSMGSNGRFAGPEEGPVHQVEVNGFFMDVHDVTNAEFRAFVDATHYVTIAERAPTVEEIMRQAPPGSAPPPPESLVAGSVVFAPTEKPVDLRDPSQWWRYTPGANWKHPEGPKSSIRGKDDYPVVHIAWSDAVAYATWAGKRLPTEAEWERAARGGRDGEEHVWGDAPPDTAKPPANIYEGTFPLHPASVKRVGSYSANAYGLKDMSGNVWQWTLDVFSRNTYGSDAASGVVRDPKGPQVMPAAGQRNPERVLRGGSYLCSDSYCRGYRISARSPGDPESGASHIGFRTVMTVEQWKARTNAAEKR